MNAGFDLQKHRTCTIIEAEDVAAELAVQLEKRHDQLRQCRPFCSDPFSLLAQDKFLPFAADTLVIFQRLRCICRLRPAGKEACRDSGEIILQDDIAGQTKIVGHQFIGAAAGCRRHFFNVFDEIRVDAHSIPQLLLGQSGVQPADLNRENIPGFDVREFYVQLVNKLKMRGF